MDAEVLLLQVHGNRRVSLFAHSHHWSFKLPLFTWRFTTFLGSLSDPAAAVSLMLFLDLLVENVGTLEPLWIFAFVVTPSRVLSLDCVSRLPRWSFAICTSAVSLTLLVDLLDADVRTLFVSTDCGTDFLGLLVPGWPVVPFSLFIVDGTLLMTWWLSTVSSSSAFSAGQLTSVSSFTSLSSSVSGSSSLSTSRELYFRLL